MTNVLSTLKIVLYYVEMNTAQAMLYRAVGAAPMAGNTRFDALGVSDWEGPPTAAASQEASGDI